MYALIGAGLATVFISSALTKVVKHEATLDYFREYLKSAALARALLYCLVLLEAAIALLSLLAPTSPTFVLLGVSFLTIASLFLGMRLVSPRASTGCPCWGGDVSPLRDLQNPRARTYLGFISQTATPAWQAFRNGGLILVICELSGVRPGVVAVAASVPSLLIGIGLVLAILMGRRGLQLKPHPAEASFAPFMEVIAGTGASGWRWSSE